LEERKDPYQVIIFSHGLGGSFTAHAIIAKELASHGFIVFCPDFDEPIFSTIQGFEELKKYRQEQLLHRYNLVKKLIDFLYDKKTLNRLFFQNNVALNFETLSVAGHALGGATALFLAYNDARIRGACICLDPWLWPMPEE